MSHDSIQPTGWGGNVYLLKYTDFVATDFFSLKGYTARTGLHWRVGLRNLFIKLSRRTCIYEAFGTNTRQTNKPWNAQHITLGILLCFLWQRYERDSYAYQAGIGWAVRFDKGNFSGKAAMEATKNDRIPARKMIAFRLEARGIAPHGMKIFKGYRKSGVVTSGSFLPSLGFSGGMALIEKDGGELGDSGRQKKTSKYYERPFYVPKV